jgi:hypothetical protein
LQAARTKPAASGTARARTNGIEALNERERVLGRVVFMDHLG